MKAPLTDEQKGLFEELFFDLYAMYQNSMAWSDNGIPFRDRIENFMSIYNKHLIADACKKQQRADELLKEALRCQNNDKEKRGLCCQCREAINDYFAPMPEGDK